MSRLSRLAPIAMATAALLVAGCGSAPRYEKPAVDTPVAWKIEAPWRESRPNDMADKGPWWERFGDARLNALEQQALAASPSVALAAARLQQARASLAAVSAQLGPSVALNSRVARQQISANRPLTNYNAPNFSTIQNDFQLGLTASYEVDFFGRVASVVAGARASEAQSTADFANARLLLTADLATNYFNLRSLDAELDVLDRSIALQRKSLGFVSSRHELGATSGLDLAQQQALLDNTLTQVDVLKRQRGVYEHAIATLTGTPAPSFALAAEPVALGLPEIPLGVPSDVLERRPDVASAERAMAAANAQIGVADAAFYPSIVLGPSIGYDSRLLPSIFDAQSLLWSLGVSAVQTIFDNGRNKANLDFSKAGYDVTVASYRRTVLTAMQEVEDGITSLAALQNAYAQSRVATESAQKVLDIATDRYEGGVATSLDVITAQQSLLNTERQSVQLRGQQLSTAVFLVKALGGDFPGASKLAAK